MRSAGPPRSMSVSIHAPRAGGDIAALTAANWSEFQSTPPARGATLSQTAPADLDEFQSTPPARGATWETEALPRIEPVSIHAPRAGGDLT